MSKTWVKYVFSTVLGTLGLWLDGGVAWAQVSAPKYSNEFLSIGVGARALGMSNAQVAIVSDVTSGYWNPAGLARMKTPYGAGLMHSEYFAGIAKYDYAGYAQVLDTVSSFGLSVIRFGVDDIPDTRFLFDANGSVNYDAVTFFSAADYAFLLSYARKNVLLKGLNAGANFKLIYRKVGDFATAWGFGLDVGTQYRVGQWNFGAVLRDATGTFNAWFVNSALLEEVFVQTGNEIPNNSLEITVPRLILGVNRSFIVVDSLLNAEVVMDANVTFDGRRNVLIKTDFLSLNPQIGVELGYKDLAFLRLGIGNYQQSKGFDGEFTSSIQPNFGVGLKIKGVQLDYALTDAFNTSDVLFSNVISITAGISP